MMGKKEPSEQSLKAALKNFPSLCGTVEKPPDISLGASICISSGRGLSQYFH